MTAIALIIYAIFLLGFIIFSIIAIYHIRKFGFKEDASSLMIYAYILTALIIIFLSLFFIATSDLGANINFGNFYTF